MNGILASAFWTSLLVAPWASVPEGEPSFFQASDKCIACHNGLRAASGEDVSFGSDWRATMMANSARDPYWQAAVRREILDHPGSRGLIENECAACHMPMARFEARARGRAGSVFGHLPVGREATPLDRLAADGVSCSLCHQITPANFGEQSSFVGGFSVDTTRPPGDREVYGPFEIDAGRTSIMRSASGFRPTEAMHLKESEMCATCHTLFTHVLDEAGHVIGELPEQVPYQEWLESDFAFERSCQSCHMEPVGEDVPITSVLGERRPGVKRHRFIGGNFFMLSMLGRYRDELGVEALPAELERAASRTHELLKTETARIAIGGTALREGTLEVDVLVENLTGHKLPTAYPSRRAWIRLVVRDRSGRVVFESGSLEPTGSIRENDNDLDPHRFEPHHLEIHREDQVQIYESIMEDRGGRVTTGLLSGLRFVKDNRLLPRGFDKSQSSEVVAVRGGAREDPDFTGGSDRVRYRIDVRGAEAPFAVEAELWFQPIAFRWAENLRPYDAAEIVRFRAYYEAMASESALVLARDEAAIEGEVLRR